jgi:hypothetical protein
MSDDGDIDAKDTGNSRYFDWNQIVTKSVETSEGKDLGKVDGLEDLYFVVKDGIINPTYYRIPREKLARYDGDKVILSLNNAEVVSAEYQKSNPGYYRRDHDPDKNSIVDKKNNAGRTSNTII